MGSERTVVKEVVHSRTLGTNPLTGEILVADTIFTEFSDGKLRIRLKGVLICGEKRTDITDKKELLRKMVSLPEKFVPAADFSALTGSWPLNEYDFISDEEKGDYLQARKLVEDGNHERQKQTAELVGHAEEKIANLEAASTAAN